MKWLGWIVSLLLLVGCTTTSKVYLFTQVPRYRVTAFLINTNDIHASYEANTADYAIPTSKWITEIVSPRLSDYLFDNNVKQWSLGDNDCVRFSVHGLSEAYTAYHHEPKRIIGSALAVGTFDYWPNTTNSHEIMFFIVNDNDGKGMKLRFYEPQAQGFILLSTNQVQSGFHWRM